MIDIKITDKALNLEICMDQIKDDSVGGIVSFVGSVRNHHKGQKVVELEFEAYEKMAHSEMNKIGEQALAQFEIEHILIHHRTGLLAIGEIPVIIIAAAAHRKAAFEACEFAIDRLKQTVPIWKKEFLEDGSYWVSAHP